MKTKRILLYNEADMSQKLTIPADYRKLNQNQRRLVRERYIKLQEGRCLHCKSDLEGPPTDLVQKRKITMSLFPKGFLDHPVHLHHNHATGMTIGAVHAKCNAVLWQYYNE